MRATMLTRFAKIYDILETVDIGPAYAGVEKRTIM